MLTPNSQKERIEQFSELLQKLENPEVRKQAYELAGVTNVVLNELKYLMPHEWTSMQAIQHLIDCHKAPTK